MAEFDQLIDETTTPGIVYIGERVPGNANTSGSVWRLRRSNENVSPIEILYANGTELFDKIWNDRTTYTYTAVS